MAEAPCRGGIRAGQTAIVASEQRPPRVGRRQKQETPAGGPAGVDGGQNALAVGVGHGEGCVPVTWKQEIASNGRRQLAEPPDRQSLIAEISTCRVRPRSLKLKRPGRELHGVSVRPGTTDIPSATKRNSTRTRPTASASLSPCEGLRDLGSALANSHRLQSFITNSNDKQCLKY